jgi:hypothetical protein
MLKLKVLLYDNLIFLKTFNFSLSLLLLFLKYISLSSNNLKRTLGYMTIGEVGPTRPGLLSILPLLKVKFCQPSHEFTFGVGTTFIPYPLVLTPLV